MPPIYYNGSPIDSVYYNGVRTTGYYNGVKVWGGSDGFSLTILSDANGTLTADTLLAPAGTTITLTPAWNDYYRFSGYSTTGIDAIINNQFIITGNCTASASFVKNAFTARGSFRTDITARTGWYMPGYVTSVNSPYCSPSEISAFVAGVKYAVKNGSNSWSTYTVTLNRIHMPQGSSAISGNISLGATTTKYRSIPAANPTGHLGRGINGAGAEVTYTGPSYPNSVSKSNSWTFTANALTTSKELGQNIYGYAYHSDHSGSYTYFTGSWVVTGLAK